LKEVLLLFFPWNFDLFISSLDGLGKTGRKGLTRAGRFENSTGFSVDLFLSLLDTMLELTYLFLLNWDEMLYLNN